MSTENKIQITKDGPYVVSGNIPLDKLIIGIGDDNEPHEYIKGEKYPSEESYSLCRCGNSHNKPFCDGSHKVTLFDGTETAETTKHHDNCLKFEGPTLDLLDAERFCSSTRFCHPEHGVWRLTRTSDDLKARVMAIKESFHCPSGRLVHIDKETGEELEPDFAQEISLLEDPQAGASGPIWVKGRIPIESSKGDLLEIRNRVTLCRCGKSENKPFCDGTHIRVGFNDSDASLK